MKQLLLCCLMLGAAVSITLAQNDAASTKHKPRETAWLGVVTQDLNERLVNKEKLKNDEGAYVTEVFDNSPADSAGIKKHDVIIEFNGKKIEDAADLSKAVRKTVPGEKIKCILVRAGSQQSLTVTVGKNNASHHHSLHVMIPPMHLRTFGERPILGLQIIEMNEQLAEYFHAPNNEGVLVEDVQKNSPAAKAGFKAGDVLVRAGKRTVDNIEDIRHELRRHEEGDKIEFEVLRHNEKKILVAEIESTDDLSCLGSMPRFELFQPGPDDATDEDKEFIFDEIKPNLDDLRLNLERMKHELQQNEFGTEIENSMIHFQPQADESTI